MRILIFVLLALVLAQTGRMNVAQERSAILNKIEAGVKERQPTWKLLKKNSTKSGDDVAYKWKAGKSSIDLLLIFVSTKEAATELIMVLDQDLEVNGLPVRFTGAQLQLGDEARPWEHALDHRYSGIMLRKGKVVANISGTNKDDISRFASLLAELLTPE